MSVVYVIEENRKIFDLIKNILMSKNDEKCIFLYDNADFSEDVKKYITDSNILIFKFVKSVKYQSEKEMPSQYLYDNTSNNINNLIDLAVLGDCKYNTVIPDIQNMYKVKTFLLNIDNANNLKNINFADTQIITCGLKEKDTVIFSSIDMDENSVILDLQRSIINIKGKTVEPFEEKITVNDNIKLEKINNVTATVNSSGSTELNELSEISEIIGANNTTNAYSTSTTNEDLIFALTTLLFCDRL